MTGIVRNGAAFRPCWFSASGRSLLMGKSLIGLNDVIESCISPAGGHGHARRRERVTGGVADGRPDRSPVCPLLSH